MEKTKCRQCNKIIKGIHQGMPIEEKEKLVNAHYKNDCKSSKKDKDTKKK